ncbi:Protein CASP [Talaromyces islandicus]|uniref:Protein CASP n=1 Tax=Talaromyces islandicus TaxID=28573 RepID=A0A0U1M1I9_TALIS|nr:Protein CASP [Talaromyces islandicus]
MDVFAVSESVIAPGEEKPDGNTGAQGQPEEANKFQRAISAWRGIDLTNTIPKIDATASEIVANQRDALVQRKDLAQKTKDFRKLDDASKLTEYKGLLKAYQTFIDLLTNHGKTSSSSFLQLYSSLSEAPDPYPLLEASVDSLVASEDTVPKLTAEKEHLQKSVGELTSQLEQTEKRLEEESTARRNLEDTLDSKTKEIEASWDAVLSEKTNNWEAKEKSLEEKIENQDRLLKELKASLEVSQRLDKGEEVDTSLNAATAAELEIVTSDLEKTSLRLAEVEARNEQMRLELAQAASHSHAEQKSIDDDPAYLRLQSENSSLLRKLDAARFDRDTERHNWESKTRQNEREAAKVLAEKEELRSKLDKYADYEEIKRELEVIKSIEFSTGDDDDTGDVAEEINSNGNGVTKSKENTLEQLLMARNKKLTNELTVLRVSHRDLQSQIATLQEEASKTKTELEKSQQLSTTLENDLFRLQKGSHVIPSAAMSVAGTYTSRYHSSRRNGATSPTSSIISGFDQGAASANAMDAIRAGEPVGGGSGLLPMIQAQRDRFKQKNSELEEELSKTYASVKSLRQEIAALQKDNLNLYEKTRYVSTYSRGQGATSASVHGNRPSAGSIQPSSETSSGLTLDRYQSAYEAQISPFAAFRGREATRAYKRMSLPERFVFSITRVVLANRTSRNLFAGYCIALHLLLFVMLYMMSAVEIEKHHIDNLASGAAAAAAAAAGGGGGGAGAGTGSRNGAHLQGDDWQQEGFS